MFPCTTNLSFQPQWSVSVNKMSHMCLDLICASPMSGVIRSDKTFSILETKISELEWPSTILYSDPWLSSTPILQTLTCRKEASFLAIPEAIEGGKHRVMVMMGDLSTYCRWALNVHERMQDRSILWKMRVCVLALACLTTIWYGRRESKIQHRQNMHSVTAFLRTVWHGKVFVC